MIGLPGAEDGNLSDSKTVWNVILDEHSTESVGGREGIDVTVVVIRSNFGDNGHGAAFWKVTVLPVATLHHRQPQAEMNLRTAGQSSSAISSGDGRNRNVHRTDRVNGKGTVDRHASKNIAVVVG